MPSANQRRPGAAHAFAAFKYLDFKADDIIVVNFSGRGDKDLNTYIDYFNL